MSSRFEAFLEKVVTEWVYEPVVFYLHAAWFTVWLILGLDINLLTLVVSLEAIFLCLGLGMSQRHHAEELKDHISETS